MELINATNEWAAAIGMRQVEADLLQRLTNPICAIRACPQAFPLLTKYYLNAA